VLLVSLASVIAYLWRYQPLSATGPGLRGSIRGSARRGDFTSPSGEYFSVYRIRYVDGETVRYGLTLHNEGPLPVAITGIGDDACDDRVFPLEFGKSLVAPRSGQFQYDPGHARPFTTVEMASGDDRFFVVESRFDHGEANSEGVGYGYTLAPVTYRIGLIARTVRLPMPFTLEVGMEPADVRAGWVPRASGTSGRTRTSSARPGCRS
jgi:hypothetical protein